MKNDQIKKIDSMKNIVVMCENTVLNLWGTIISFQNNFKWKICFASFYVIYFYGENQKRLNSHYLPLNDQ